MNSPQESQNQISLPNEFSIYYDAHHPKQTAITKNGNEYDLLTAFPDHPYCEKAEGFFQDAFVNGELTISTERVYIDQKITLYLRNRETFLVEPIVITGNIGQKITGVKSGIITSPEEFVGILCCPPKKPGESWIAFRPYDSSYLNRHVNKTGIHRQTPEVIPPHVHHLPNIRPAKSHSTRLEHKDRRNIDFAKLPPNIIMAEKEFREYFTNSTFVIV